MSSLHATIMEIKYYRKIFGEIPANLSSLEYKNRKRTKTRRENHCLYGNNSDVNQMKAKYEHEMDILRSKLTNERALTVNLKLEKDLLLNEVECVQYEKEVLSTALKNERALIDKLEREMNCLKLQLTSHKEILDSRGRQINILKECLIALV